MPIAARSAVVRQLVRNATDHDDDPVRLEKVRRQAGRMLDMQQAQT